LPEKRIRYLFSFFYFIYIILSATRYDNKKTGAFHFAENASFLPSQLMKCCFESVKKLSVCLRMRCAILVARALPMIFVNDIVGIVS